MDELTPMMRQYSEIKDKCRDCILFYRLGDFYEMFFEDAKLASKELDLTLTGRDCGREERAPMCGVPHHAASTYIARLISKGYKVAICEQTEDPALAKGLVNREIIRIITPGTVLESNILDQNRNNFIASVYCVDKYYGLAYADISTGLFMTTQITYGNTSGRLADELSRIAPPEIITNLDGSLLEEFNTSVSSVMTSAVSYYDYKRDLNGSEMIIKDLFGSAQVLDPQYELAMLASAMLAEYISGTQKKIPDNLDMLEYYTVESYMIIDPSTRKNLELFETIREQSRKGSLISILDKTRTAMGARMIRQYISQPLIDVNEINKRLDAVTELKDNYIMRSDMAQALDGIYDIERIVSRVSSASLPLRELTTLKHSLARLPELKKILSAAESELIKSLNRQINEFPNLHDLINRSIVDEPPASVKDGGYIKPGFSAEIDELVSIKTDGAGWLRELEQRERERTQIKNLRIRYNKVFGYFIEITNSYAAMVPDTYIRRQTLSNAERYITPELKDFEDRILGADSRLARLELAVLNDVREEIRRHTGALKRTGNSIAALDAIHSLAQVSFENRYCRPEVNNFDEISITAGRHPVVEKITGEGSFVPNDVKLDLNDYRFSIITGPNMAGKSTFMRQTALIVLLSQAGSHVPADKAVIGIADRIFTRVGASDDLSLGQSTFMVEMTEMANILKNATSRSLLLLDEIGRGTSTFDGLSIAWAVTEYIAKKENLGARTLFATHFHELTELEGKLGGVMNYCVNVLEEGDRIVFLRKIVKGGADDSYGIHVAKLAGIPQKVIERAKAIAEELKRADINRLKTRRRMADSIEGQLDVFTVFSKENAAKIQEEHFLNDLREIEISRITPIEALNRLYELQAKYLKGQ